VIDWRALTATQARGWIILVRLAIGAVVFVPEGIQKLVFPDLLGAGRFAAIGFPNPQLIGPLVGLVEIACGALIVVGLLTRLAVVPLIVVMLVAIVSTKVPIWLGHDLWIFHVPKMARLGFWSMAHEARTDVVMLLTLLYLLVEGSGVWSIDAAFADKGKRR